MKTQISSLEYSHFPVMLSEVVQISSPEKGGIFVDCTFGGGGYSKALLKFPKTKVIAIDRDPAVVAISKKFKKVYLPEPDSPQRPVISPTFKIRDASSKTLVLILGYLNERFSI